jgi:Putative DNA-binding domain
MRPLVDSQREFAMALLDPALSIPLGLFGPDRRPSPKRFAVYRNNVVAGLIEAVQANFPATARIVGEEFFRAMARAYVVSEPPTSPILLDYGAGFPDFVARFEPAGSLPYLPDVARIERAWTEAYHAHEATPFDPSALAVIPLERISDICFTLHPSVRIVRSRFPALTIWRMNLADGLAAPVDLHSGGEDALVMRPAADVEVRSLPTGGAQFITALAKGNSLAEAAKSALKASSGFDLSANLAALIGVGIFVGYSFAETHYPAVVEAFPR